MSRRYVQSRRRVEKMPKTSKESASQVEDMGVMEGRYEQLKGYMVGFETFREDVDAAPFFKGLPDDRCQAEHWGYIFKGRVTFRYADHEEVYEAGDAYYAPAGHVNVIEAGTELVEFSPGDQYAKTLEVVERNLDAMQTAAQ
jgi:mannose-6-phosphate isomerase-like protein (cupin superfamily)